MRYTILLLFTFFALSCGNDSSTQAASKNGITEQGAMIKFTHETSEKDIAELKKELSAKHNVQLSDDGTLYFEDGRIQQLRISLTLPNGAGGKTQASSAQLKENGYGFEFKKKDGVFQMVKMGKLD